MTDVLKMGRKALTVGVALTTIAWSMMAAVLVAPLQASAAGCTSGTLVKGSLAAVYYCGGDGKRYVFPNEKTYKTWYADFSGVTTISDSDLASLQIGGNATYRPGVKMVKITTDPKVYAVSKGGVLQPVKDEATATALYGSNWNKQIDDVPDAFFTNYTVGSAVNSASDYDKNAAMSGSQSINADKNLAAGASTGALSASLASDNPAASTIPAGATSVNALKFKVTNGGSTDTTVDTLTVHRSGPGATTDIATVYLYEGPTRLTTGRTVNSTTNDVTFTGLGWKLTAGQARTFWVGVNFSTTPGAGNVHAFSLTAGTAGSASLGGLPLSGNNLTMSSATVGSITIAQTGALTNPKVGQTNTEVATFQLTAGSSEDIWVNRITLFQAGNLASGNLLNMKLSQAGNVLATSTGPDAKSHVVFNLATPMLLTKGSVKTFDVYADLGGSARSGDSLKLYVEEDGDVYATGATFGYGVSVTRTLYNGSPCATAGDPCSVTTVQGGQLTITFNGPSSTNVASNAKGVELFNFTLASQGNVEVRKVTLAVACTTSSADVGGCKQNTNQVPNYTNIKIVNTATGATWWGPQDLSGATGASDSSQTLAFTDVQTLAAGSSQTFRVLGDVSSLVPTSDTVKVTLNAFGASDLRNLDNSTFVATTDIVPSGNIAGNSMTIQAPSLTLSVATTPVSQTFVSGSTAVPAVGLNLKAGDGSNIKVTSLTMTGYVSDTNDADASQGKEGAVAVSDDVLSCKLWDGSNQVGDAKSPTTSTGAGTGGLLQFTNLNLTVPASATKSLTLTCDISNSAPKGGSDNNLTFAVQNSGDVNAQDSNGNTVTPTGTINAGTPAGGANPGTITTVTTSGSMTFVQAPNDSESEANLSALAGASNVVMAKYRLTASKEDLKVVKLRAFLMNQTAGRSISSLSLYDGSTLISGPVTITNETVGSATATAQFTGMSYVVPKNSSKTLSVRGTMNTIPFGAKTGDDLKVALYLPGTDLLTGSPAAISNVVANSLEIRGTSSSTVIRQVAGASQIVQGNSRPVRKTKPTLSPASLPTTVLTNGGGIVAARFTLTADASENVSFKKVSFKVANTTSGDTTANPALREVGQGSNIASASATVQTDGTTNCGFAASALVKCVTIVFSSEQVVAAGTSKTYELRLDTTGFASGEAMSSTLLGDSVDAVGALLNAAGPQTGVDDSVHASANSGTYNFLWSDNNQIPHNDTIGGSTDWTNGNLVKVLPGDAQTLTRS